jgi:hypothetical protein
VTVPVAYPSGPTAPFAIRVPGGAVELHGHGLTVTRLVGCRPLDACAVDSPYYRGKAAEFGHGADLDGFVRWHELGHHLLAAALRLPVSPTLHGVATGNFSPVWRLEEGAVEAFHRYAKAVGVDLVKLATEAGEKG